MLIAPLLVAPDMASARAETRTLKLYNVHTKERVQITFKKDGRYIPSALRDANRFLRDWRRNEITNIDPKLLDLVWEVYQQVGGRDYINVVSSYRSPATNNMLRSRSRGVAQKSQHMLGKAMDFFIPGVDLATLRATGLRKQVGGVGFYPTSGSPFVHMDTGSVRHWPKMNRQQLAKVFPDGKTIHIPSDGKPMPGYQQALAELKSGKRSAPIVVASASEDDEGGSSNSRLSTRGQTLSSGDDGRPVRQVSKGGNFLTALFSGEDDDIEQAAAEPDEAPAQVRPGAVAARGTPAAAPVATPAAAPERAPAPVAEAPVITAAVTPKGKPEEMREPSNIPFQIANADAGGVSADEALRQPVAVTQAAVQQVALVAVPHAKPQTAAASAMARTNDPLAAILAATGTQPAPKPQLAASALAYASQAATQPQPSTQDVLRAKAAEAAAKMARDKKKPSRPAATLAGLVPAQIKDPLAGFARAPDKTSPEIISAESTLRTGTFAKMSHPNQRKLTELLEPGNRFLKNGFTTAATQDIRADRFSGTAVAVLPVIYTR